MLKSILHIMILIIHLQNQLDKNLQKQEGILYQLSFLKLYSNMCLQRMILATLYKYFLVVLGMLSLLIKYLSVFLCFGYLEEELYFIVIFLINYYFREKIVYQKNLQIFLGFIEQISIIFANLVLVNSEKQQSEVLYSAIQFSKFESPPDLNRHDSTLITNSYFISLNRYERKKNIALAIYVFAVFRQSLSQDENIETIRLVVARGYEQRVEENAYFQIKISDTERTWFMSMHQLYYIPEREHLGIVSLEAMYSQVSVIACNSGGPNESIQNGVNGYLCDSKTNEWCQKMIEIHQNKKLSKKL
ncbi:unnamed protein product [Paramecium primaurelia]|uniref:Alpha-1,3/1,6-mannosyltransferase ALG2 n=1 Tax=Paramecium primaurelia TaxID=5886 RepID=A0A8S1JQU6_PARPR|nr:unnamed protein product [Paramecium primaurelia]